MLTLKKKWTGSLLAASSRHCSVREQWITADRASLARVGAGVVGWRVCRLDRAVLRSEILPTQFQSIGLLFLSFIFPGVPLAHWAGGFSPSRPACICRRTFRARRQYYLLCVCRTGCLRGGGERRLANGAMQSLHRGGRGLLHLYCSDERGSLVWCETPTG